MIILGLWLFAWRRARARGVLKHVRAFCDGQELLSLVIELIFQYFREQSSSRIWIRSTKLEHLTITSMKDARLVEVVGAGINDSPTSFLMCKAPGGFSTLGALN